jgi:hypothetical protein
LGCFFYDQESVVVVVDTKQNEDEKIAAKVDEKSEESIVEDKESIVLEDNYPTDAISRLDRGNITGISTGTRRNKERHTRENHTDSLMSVMMDRKLTERFEQMAEAQWEQRLQQVTNDAEVVSKQVDR